MGKSSKMELPPLLTLLRERRASVRLCEQLSRPMPPSAPGAPSSGPSITRPGPLERSVMFQMHQKEPTFKFWSSLRKHNALVFLSHPSPLSNQRLNNSCSMQRAIFSFMFVEVILCSTFYSFAVLPNLICCTATAEQLGLFSWGTQKEQS